MLEMKKGVSKMVKCPYCHSTTVGKVGTAQYYCWNCYYEFNVKAEQVKMFRIVEDGTLAEAKEMNC